MAIIEYDGHIYEAWEDTELDWKYYSKAWHQMHGPKRTIISRTVWIDRVIVREYDRWPHGGEYAALLLALPFDAMPLFVNDPDTQKIVKKRLLKGK
jgi:hypothetical protein